MQLDNKRCGQQLMVVDNTKMLVPVQEENLEHTRETNCLAIHGINDETSEEDLRTVFPRANRVNVAVRGGSAFLKYDKKEECIEDFIHGEDIEVRGVNVVVMFGHNLLGIDMAKRGDRDDLRGKLNITRNKESWEPFIQFLKIRKKETEVVIEGDNEVNFDLLEVLFSCSLWPERMEMEVIRAKGMEEERDIKTKWLDSMVGRAIEKDAVAYHEARHFSRGEFRELVEDIWTYFLGNKDNKACGDSKKYERSIRNKSKS